MATMQLWHVVLIGGPKAGEHYRVPDPVPYLAFYCPGYRDRQMYRQTRIAEQPLYIWEGLPLHALEKKWDCIPF